ncbi:MAG: hypothetical protein Kow006_31670 [Gammaproteobacteria bacterium]
MGILTARLKLIIQMDFRSLLKTFCLFLLGLCLPFAAGAQDNDHSIGIWYSASSSTQFSIAESVSTKTREMLAEKGRTASIHLVNIDNPARPFPSYSLSVVLGEKAARTYQSVNAISPITLYGLMSRVSMEAFLSSHKTDSKRAFGIHLDQPIERLLKLAKLSFNNLKSVGFILSPRSSFSVGEIRLSSRLHNLTPILGHIDESSDLIFTTEKALGSSDALIAIPDAAVFNRYTVQKILLTTYRKGKPVFGYSSALVRAGAVAAVYSSPDDIGLDISEQALDVLLNAELPSFGSRPPKYFSVSVNNRVSRALGLKIPTKETLLRSLRESEGR